MSSAGVKLADGTWDQMPKSVSEHPTLSLTAKGLFAMIASFIRPGEFKKMLTADLARWAGISDRTAQTTVAELTKAEVLTVRRTRTKAGHQGPNEYGWGAVALAAQTAESDGLDSQPDRRIRTRQTAENDGSRPQKTQGVKSSRARPKSQTPPTPQQPVRAAGTKDGGEDFSERQDRDSEQVAQAEQATSDPSSSRLEERSDESGRVVDEWSAADWSSVGLPDLATLTDFLAAAGGVPRNPVAVLRARIRRDGLAVVRAQVEDWLQQSSRVDDPEDCGWMNNGQSAAWGELGESTGLMGPDDAAAFLAAIGRPVEADGAIGMLRALIEEFGEQGVRQQVTDWRASTGKRAPRPTGLLAYVQSFGLDSDEAEPFLRNLGVWDEHLVVDMRILSPGVRFHQRVMALGEDAVQAEVAEYLACPECRPQGKVTVPQAVEDGATKEDRWHSKSA